MQESQVVSSSSSPNQNWGALQSLPLDWHDQCARSRDVCECLKQIWRQWTLHRYPSYCRLL